MPFSCIFNKRNIDKTTRSGEPAESRTVVRYVNQLGPSGADGAPSFLAYITPQSHTISAGPMYATDGQPDRIINVLVFRGGVQIPAKIGTITGLPSGITITPQNNNTTEAHLLVHVTSTLSEDGSVNIPISYNADVTDTADPNFWDASVYDIETTTSVYSWTLAKSSTSLWVLDLTNETAKINADSSGNIDASAYRPECQARLAFGADNELEGVYYSVSTRDASVQGVGVDHSTGELILDYNNVPFQFGDLDNTILEIRFDASYEGTVRGSKVMTIEKSLPGQSGPAGSTPYIGDDGYWYIDGVSTGVKAEGDNGQTPYIGANGNWWIGNTDTGTKAEADTPYIGQNGNWWIGTTDTGVKAEGDNGITPHIGPNGNWWIGSQDTGVKAEGTEGAAAVTRWLSLSADQVKVDASNNVIPDKIYATAYKQTGGETPTTDSSAVIKWAHDSSTTSTVYTSSGVSVTSTWNYLTFKLYDEDGSTYLGESETVPVLRDGKNGEPGAVGPRGAIIRGPVEWDPSVVRRYCSGAQNGSDSQYHPEDASYIDIVLKDSSLYQCIKSFTQNSGDAWKGSTYWQPADAECNFVATKLLLAKNAKIDFLTGNELYLTDASGNISGGGRAAGNGSDVIFWAGSDASTGNINNAQFQVDYNGNLKATSGTFAGYIQMKYVSVLSLPYVEDTADGMNYRTMSPGTKAYLISMPTWWQTAQNRRLKLPTPTAALNGFMYDIIIQGPINQYYRGSELTVVAEDDSTIACYAFPESRYATRWLFGCGRVTICCTPYTTLVQGGLQTLYRWCILSATGTMTRFYTQNNETKTEYISTVLGTSFTSSNSMIYNILTYTGTKPSADPDIYISNPNNIMYVQK